MDSKEEECETPPVQQSDIELASMSATSEVQATLPGSAGQEEAKLSKNQLRKLAKRERTAEMKPIWRARYRENKKKRKAEAREKGEEFGGLPKKFLKKNTMANSSCSVKVIIDCSFDHLMKEKDIVSLGSQIQRCYSINRRMNNPMQLYVGSFNDKIKERMDSYGNYRGWDLNIKEEAYHEFLEKEKIVYLSSESPNILTELEDDKAYIIGGLVDHNKQKGICHRLAEESKTSHAKLPIGEFIEMKGRKVLTIDSVFEILAKFTETKNWEEAFFTAIPKRKELVSKSSQNITTSNSSETLGEGEMCEEGTTKETTINSNLSDPSFDSGNSEHVCTEKLGDVNINSDIKSKNFGHVGHCDPSVNLHIESEQQSNADEICDSGAGCTGVNS